MTSKFSFAFPYVRQSLGQDPPVLGDQVSPVTCRGIAHYQGQKPSGLLNSDFVPVDIRKGFDLPPFMSPFEKAPQ